MNHEYSEYLPVSNHDYLKIRGRGQRPILDPMEEDSKDTHGKDSNQSVSLEVYNIAGCVGEYVDLASVSNESVKQILQLPKKKRKGPRGGVNEPFPKKLYEMLVRAEEDNLRSIISWRSHGRSFAISDPESLSQLVLPNYFQQSKLNSFKRQINLYGFQKVSCGVDKGSFFHPLFLRGRPDFCMLIMRTKSKGNFGTVTTPGCKATTCKSFYDLPHCPPAHTNTTRQHQSSLPVATAEWDRMKRSITLSPSVPTLRKDFSQTISSLGQIAQAGHLLSTGFTLDNRNQQSPFMLDQRTRFDHSYASTYTPRGAYAKENNQCPSMDGQSHELLHHSADYHTSRTETFSGRHFQPVDDSDIERYESSVDNMFPPCS